MNNRSYQTNHNRSTTIPGGANENAININQYASQISEELTILGEQPLKRFSLQVLNIEARESFAKGRTE